MFSSDISYISDYGTRISSLICAIKKRRGVSGLCGRPEIVSPTPPSSARPSARSPLQQENIPTDDDRQALQTLNAPRWQVSFPAIYRQRHAPATKYPCFFANHPPEGSTEIRPPTYTVAAPRLRRALKISANQHYFPVPDVRRIFRSPTSQRAEESECCLVTCPPAAVARWDFSDPSYEKRSRKSRWTASSADFSSR